MIQPHATGGHFHAVGFHTSSASLCDLVARFLAEGLVAGQAAIVVAKPDHRAQVAERLSALGHDPDPLEARGDLFLLDAAGLLTEILVEGMPRVRRFRHVVEPLFERAASGRRRRSVRAYGEMVDLLWKASRPAAAIRLEKFWNQLARQHEFSLLCGYDAANLYPNTAIERICAQHTHVLSGPVSAASLC